LGGGWLVYSFEDLLLLLCTDTTVNVADEEIPILWGYGNRFLYLSLFHGHGWNSEEHDVPYLLPYLFLTNYINATPLTY